MKVQCEVCMAETASVFCCADEAALCDSCDRHVHCANRLARKHHRFSLLHTSSSTQSTRPLCDVCKEKRGFLFCQEDRAILCRDCDLPIHTTEVTMKHRRFLLTGIRLSTTPMTSSPEAEGEALDSMNGSCNIKANGSSSMVVTTMNSNNSIMSQNLMTLPPGWDVKDLILEDAITHAFCKTENNQVKPFYVMDTSNSVLNGSGGAFPSTLPQVPCWVAGCEGIGLEEVEMKASTDAKRRRISVRFL